MNRRVATAAGALPASGLEAEEAEVLNGLLAAPPRVSPRYFYDEAGSRLFEAICRQPEYYPTRTETAILGRHREELAALLGAGVLLLEPGSGSAEKTGLVLAALARPAGYVPVDVCREQLVKAAGRLQASHRGLRVLPVCADFTRAFPLPHVGFPPARRVVFFPGSTIGNFPTEDARLLLARFRELAGPEGALLIGVDLVKAPGILHQAYNDAAGITARFNLNLLRHLNTRFGSDFDPSAFRHAAVWYPEHSRIEMQLWPRRNQCVRFAGRALEFPIGKKLVTEWSHKYTLEGFGQLAAEAGWHQKRIWLDEERWFSVQYLEASKGEGPTVTSG